MSADATMDVASCGEEDNEDLALLVPSKPAITVSPAGPSLSAQSSSLVTTSLASTVSRNTSRCGYCLQRLNRSSSFAPVTLQPMHVVCAVCPDLRLCLRCFALGAEGGKHQRSHDYRLATCHLPLLPADSDGLDDGGAWTWEEEVRLLDAIDAFGYGNWADIGARVLSDRTCTKGDPGLQCCRHYERHYIRGLLRPSRIFSGGPAAAVASATVQDLTVDSPPSSPPLVPLSLSTDLTAEECQRLGLAPLRDFEFEQEYDRNIGEELVCRLRPCFEADQLDSALRAAQIDAYRQRLRLRSERKRLIRCHGLLTAGLRRALADSAAAAVSPFSQPAPPPPPSPLKRRPFACDCDAFTAADSRLRPFLRYLKQPDCRQLIDCMARADRLRAELAQLTRLRNLGVRRLPDSLASSAGAVSPFGEFSSIGVKSSLPVLTRNGAATPPPLLKQQKNAPAPPPPLPSPLLLPPQSKSSSASIAASTSRPQLSKRERQFCRSLRLSHDSYQLMKLYLLAEQSSLGQQRQQLQHCHPGLRTLLAFFCKQGWVTIG